VKFSPLIGEKIRICNTKPASNGFRSEHAFFEYRAKPMSTPNIKAKKPQHFTTPEPSMIFTLVLENGRRDSLLYLRVVTVFELLRLVERAVERGPWTYIEISKG
jgi:hypothetical protein